MSKKLAEIRSAIRQMLQDEFAEVDLVWTDDELDQNIESYLRDLSQVVPYQTKLTVESDGTREVDLNDITDLDISTILNVKEAEYPVDQYPKDKRNVSRMGDIITLDIDYLPTSGDDIYLYCDIVHTLDETTSTLNVFLENALIIGASGLSASSKSLNLYNLSNKLTDDITAINAAIDAVMKSGAGYLAEAATAISNGNTIVGNITALISDADDSFDLMKDLIDAAQVDMGTGEGMVNTITTGGGASEYFQLANTQINLAQGRYNTGLGILNKIQARGTNNTAYLQQATAQLNAAGASLNQASGYMKQISTKLNIASSGRLLEQWGMNQTNVAKQKLDALKTPKRSIKWPRS